MKFNTFLIEHYKNNNIENIEEIMFDYGLKINNKITFNKRININTRRDIDGINILITVSSILLLLLFIIAIIF